MNAFSFIQTPVRSRKPRSHGVTMVLDKSLSVTELEGLLLCAADYIDIVKMGWGTSATAPVEVVRAKCDLLNANGIDACPGGTLFELAYIQGKFPQFLNEARTLGFRCIEISNGTVPMDESAKLDCIKRALDGEFKVVSEVGSKIAEEDRRMDVANRVDQARRELEAGVWKVIMEARESGTLGIFDTKGATNVDMLSELLASLEVDQLIFEAPLKAQQVDLILRFGSKVNLGNIAPQEVVSLETLRLGLRGDTLRNFHLALPHVRVELGPAGALVASRRGDVIVVVDAIRATSTIVTALANGMSSVKTVASADQCVGEVTAGERGGKKIPTLDQDNSPLAFDNCDYIGKQLVLTSTNGTECIAAAAANPDAVVLIGSLLNASSVAEAALETARTTGKDITIALAGRNNQAVSEDVIAGSEIINKLHGAPLSTDIPLIYSKDFVVDFLNSDSGKNLSFLGRSEDVVFCAQKDRYDLVPILRDGVLQPMRKV